MASHKKLHVLPKIKAIKFYFVSFGVPQRASTNNALKLHTDGNNILHTPLLKHYNDLLERQSSVRGKNEVSYF